MQAAQAEVAIDGICFSVVFGSGLRWEQGTIHKLDGEVRITWCLWTDEDAAVLVQTHLFLFWSTPQHTVALVWQIPPHNSQIWSMRCVSSVASWCNPYNSDDSVSSAFSVLWDFYLNVTHHSTIANEVCCYFKQLFTDLLNHSFSLSFLLAFFT